MSLLDLLHDDGSHVVISRRQQCAGDAPRWFNQLFFKLNTAAKVLARFQPHIDELWIKTATHDGVKNAPSPSGYVGPDCHTEHFPRSRTIMIDVDAGPGKKYDTVKQGFTELVAAIRKLAAEGMPTPTVLNQTGHGLHALWVRQTTLPAVDWERDKNTLTTWLGGAGLRFDLQGSNRDKAARVCGPQRFNLGDPANPAPTEISFQLTTRIPDAKWDAWFVPRRNAALPRNASNVVSINARQANAEFAVGGGPQNLRDAVAHCVVLKESLATGGAGQGYEEWFHVITQLAKHADPAEALAWAHAASNQHADYDARATENKFYGVQKEKNYAAVHCDTMASLSARFKDACSRCPFNGRIKSVAGMSMLLAEPVVAPPPAAVATGTGPVVVVPFPGTVLLPNPLYRNAKDGVVHGGGVDGDGNPQVDVILPRYHILEVKGFCDMADPKTCTDMEFQYGYIGEMGVRTLRFDTRVLSDARMMQQAFGALYWPVESKLRDGALTMFVSFKQELERKRQLLQLPKQLGWVPGGYVTGRELLQPGGASQPLPDVPGWEGYGPHGDAAVNRQIADMALANDRRPEAHTLYAVAAASPLLKLVGCPGFVVNFYSVHSGHGKTTLANLGLSMFGDPRAFTSHVDDTMASLELKLGRGNTMPHLFDDMSSRYLRDFINQVVFRASTGQGRSRRSASENVLQEQSSWNAMLICTSNFDMTSKLRGPKYQNDDAALARCLDFEMPPIAGSTVGAGTMMGTTTVLEENNGHVGVAYARYLVEHKAAVSRALTNLVNNLMQAHGADAHSLRLHLAAVAAIRVAAVVLASQKLAPIDPQLVTLATDKALAKAAGNRAEVRSSITAEEVISGFLHSLGSNRIVLTRLAGVTSLASDEPVRHPLAYEIDVAADVAHLDMASFTQFVKESSRELTMFEHELTAPRYRRVRWAIGAGTPYGAGERETLRIDLAGTPWSGMGARPKRP